MRPVRSLAIFVAVVFFGGDLLAPWPDRQALMALTLLLLFLCRWFRRKEGRSSYGGICY